MSVLHTPVLCRNGQTNIIKLFRPRRAIPIIVFQQKTLWQYSDGGPHDGVVAFRGGGEKLRFSTNITIYLGNVTSLEHSYCGMRIGNRTHAFYDTILNDLEWLSEIFNDTKHRAVSPRYLSFLSDGPLSKRIPACCPAGSPGGKHVIHFRLQPACDDRGGPSHFCIPYFLDPISSFAPRSYWKLCENVHVDDKCFYNLVFCLPEATKLKTDRLPTHAHKCLKFRKVVQTIHPSRAGTFMSKVPNFDRFGAVVHISEQTKNVKFGTVSNFTLIGVTYPQCFIQTPKHWGEITTAGGSTIERRRREVETKTNLVHSRAVRKPLVAIILSFLSACFTPHTGSTSTN